MRNVSLEAHDISDEGRKIADGYLLAGADVDDFWIVVVLQQELDGGSQVINMNELSQRSPRSQIITSLALLSLASWKRRMSAART